MAEIRIGISGWTYAPWRGVFYPAKLGQKNELSYAADLLRSIEINGTFYSLQRPSSFAAWAEATPEDFVFAVKAPRFITHNKRLRNVVAPLANFFASGILRLGKRLGPILWQLPPSLAFDAPRLEEFFTLLPRSTKEAATLARHHDQRLRWRAWLQADGDLPLRHALEVRHASFETRGFVDLMRRHDIAIVVADTAGKWPLLKEVTSDFVYVRLHGAEELYASGYTAEALKTWATDIRAWARGGEAAGARFKNPPGRGRARSAYVYFDNDVKTYAPFDALTLAHELGLGPPPPPRGTPPVPKTEAVRLHWPGFSRAQRARGKSLSGK